MTAVAGISTAWLIARSAGLVAFGILTLSTWLGLAMSTRLLGPKRQRALLGWHRTLAGAGLAMIALHVGALLLDPVVHFNLLSRSCPSPPRGGRQRWPAA